ncbi:MAG: M23 family metallopeptidase, partial [Acidimicrobiales bacterium]|nr:M23 family metallopeptidase [Acidimicrobiales bacterium]
MSRPSLSRIAAAATLLASLMAALLPSPSAAVTAPQITLPVAVDHLDSVHWTDTWGAPRSGGRIHVGVDMIGPKMTPLVAAADGTITWMRHDTSRGNIIYLTDDAGWQYTYIHINNDTPGTDDGANRYEEAFAPGIERGARVNAGDVIAYMGDSGNAEWTVSHLHFEIVSPDGVNVNPAPIVDEALERALRTVPEVDPARVAPFDSFEQMADNLYRVVHGRTADDAELADLATT